MPGRPAARHAALAALIAATTACVARHGAPDENRSPSMSTRTHRSQAGVVRSLYEAGLNTGDLTAVDRAIAPEFVGAGGRGPAAFARTVVELRAAFPDIRYTIEDVVEEGDRVAIRWTWTGTHEGPFRGFPPTRRKVSTQGLAVFQLTDGKIVRSWVETDRLGFLQQIGGLPDDVTARLQPGPRRAD